MEATMGLTKKTTILLSPRLHVRLKELARAREQSIGELVREAVIAQYGLVTVEERLAAVRELGALELPVADPGPMKRESVWDPDAAP